MHPAIMLNNYDYRVGKKVKLFLVTNNGCIKDMNIGVEAKMRISIGH